MIDDLFANRTILATKLENENWSPEKLLPIVERLHQRLRRSMGKTPLASRNVMAGFQIADVRNSAGEANEEERIRLTFYLADLLAAAQKLDEDTARGKNPNMRWNGRAATMIETKLRELQRGNEVKVDPVLDSGSINSYAQQSLGNPEVHATFTKTPRWLPPALVYFIEDARIAAGSMLNPDDLAVIQNNVISGSKFSCSSIEQYSSVACFSGSFKSPRVLSPENYTSFAIAEIEERFHRYEVSQRVQLLFISDISRSVEGQGMAILAIPRSVPTSTMRSPSTSLFACVIAVVTTAVYSVSCFALNPHFFDAVMNHREINPCILLSCSPIFAGVIGVQVIHEVAHHLLARRDNVQLAIPVPLPSPELGICGATTSFRTFPPNLNSMFDISISGPLSGMLVSVGCFVVGLITTLHSPASTLNTFPFIPIAFLKKSFLTGAIVSIFAPKLMILPMSQPIPVHPAICIGLVGLISNAINMLPIVGLDGGRAFAAIVGRGRAYVASVACTITLCLSFIQGNDMSMFPSLAVIYFFGRLGRKPWMVRNEIVQVNDARIYVFLASFFLAGLTLIPFPGGQGFL